LFLPFEVKSIRFSLNTLTRVSLGHCGSRSPASQRAQAIFGTFFIETLYGRAEVNEFVAEGISQEMRVKLELCIPEASQS
jgi:hypothetical protein